MCTVFEITNNVNNLYFCKWSTSLNILLGNESEAPIAPNITTTRNQTAARKVTLVSLHSQWNESQYHASEDCPHLLGCCFSFNVVRTKPIDVCFLSLAHRSPCQQCYDSVADPDIARSAAGVKFLFYHSNFVVHHLELKARKTLPLSPRQTFQLITRASHHLYTAQLDIGDFVHLPLVPNWLKIFMMRHTYPWYMTIHWQITLKTVCCQPYWKSSARVLLCTFYRTIFQ